MQMRIGHRMCAAVIPIRAEKRKQLTILLAREQREEIGSATFDSSRMSSSIRHHQVSLWARSDNASSGISGGVSLGNLI